MMLFDEDLLTLADATKILPKSNGKRPAVSTLWRWAVKGVSGIRLDTRKVGGRLFTSREALERFTTTLADVGADARTRNALPKPRNPKRRAREVAEAEKELAAAGL